VREEPSLTVVIIVSGIIVKMAKVGQLLDRGTRVHFGIWHLVRFIRTVDWDEAGR